MLNEMGGFTLFVLTVSIGLSFVLRKLIVDIDQIKSNLALEIQELTSQLVAENPSLEKYQQLGELYFRLDQYERAMKVFDYLLSQGTFQREGRYFRVLCLLGCNRTEEAKGLFEELDLTDYSEGEISQLKRAMHRKTSLFRFGDIILNLLLTNVSFYVGPGLEAVKDSKEQELNRVLTLIPTRYMDVKLAEEVEDSRIFRCKDKHLDRSVRLHIAREDISDDKTRQFLQHPRILAKLQSRAFPQVYDLQHSTVTFYCLEEFEGDDVLSVLGEYRTTSKDREFLNLWISLLSHIEYLTGNGVRLRRLVLADIFYDRLKDRLFFSGNLMEVTGENLRENQRQIRQVLFQSLEDHLNFQEKISNEFQNLFERLRESDPFSTTISLIHLLEETTRQIFSWQESSSKVYLQQLKQLEKIHRASVHGLKGKFSIVSRYGDQPQKLLKTFFRVSNVEDIKDKIIYLMELIRQLEDHMESFFFPICAEIREKNFTAFLEQLESTSKINFEADGVSLEKAHKFLKAQNEYFEGLSHKLATFISEHEIHLARVLESFVQGVSDPKLIRLEMPEDCSSLKACALDRENFQAKIRLVLENLMNNGLEAGAESIVIRVGILEPGFVSIDFEDDGPGIPENVLQELMTADTYSLGEGGTGLIASKNAVEVLGGQMQVNPKKIARGTLIRIILSAYLA